MPNQGLPGGLTYSGGVNGGKINVPTNDVESDVSYQVQVRAVHDSKDLVSKNCLVALTKARNCPEFPESLVLTINATFAHCDNAVRTVSGTIYRDPETYQHWQEICQEGESYDYWFVRYNYAEEPGGDGITLDDKSWFEGTFWVNYHEEENKFDISGRFTKHPDCDDEPGSETHFSSEIGSHFFSASDNSITVDVIADYDQDCKQLDCESDGHDCSETCDYIVFQCLGKNHQMTRRGMDDPENPNYYDGREDCDGIIHGGSFQLTVQSDDYHDGHRIRLYASVECENDKFVLNPTSAMDMDNDFAEVEFPSVEVVGGCYCYCCGKELDEERPNYDPEA